MSDVRRLHLVTPETPSVATLDATRAALGVGPVSVQVRTKAVDDRARLAFAEQLVELCASFGAPCLVNDRVDLALAAGAGGVHVGDEDLPPAVARRLLGPDAIVGATCRRPETAREAEAAGATYIGSGPAYASTTKRGLPEPLGPRGIGAVARAVSVPVIAISGVTAARVPDLLAAGAHGVAVVAGVYGAADPAAATEELLRALGELP